MTNKLRGSAGFTLMELLIVIMILGILMGVLIPAVNNALKKAKIGTTETLLLKLKNGITLFHGEFNKYPNALKDLVERPKGGDEKVTKKWRGPYGLDEGEKVPEDSWGEKFYYKLTPPPAKRPYELYSHGPGGKGSPKEDRISVWND
jgi:general secretion pathway protein G